MPRVVLPAILLPPPTATEDLFKIELLSQLNVFSAIADRVSERWVEPQNVESTSLNHIPSGENLTAYNNLLKGKH